MAEMRDVTLETELAGVNHARSFLRAAMSFVASTTALTVLMVTLAALQG